MEPNAMWPTPLGTLTQVEVPEGAAVPELVKLKMETKAKLAEVEMALSQWGIWGIPQNSTLIGTMMKTHRIWGFGGVRNFQTQISAEPARESIFNLVCHVRNQHVFLSYAYAKLHNV